MLAERINVGSDDRPNYIPRYTLDQLLDPGFIFPRTQDDGVVDLEQTGLLDEAP